MRGWGARNALEKGTRVCNSLEEKENTVPPENCSC